MVEQVPSGMEVFLDDMCVVDLSASGMRRTLDYIRAGSVDLGRFADPKNTLNGFPVRQLLHTFAPLFQERTGAELPFQRVTFILERPQFHAIQSIHVSDFLYVPLTYEGEALLQQAFPVALPFRQIGPFTRMQFYTMAYAFSPHVLDRHPFVDDKIVLPPNPSLRSEPYG